MLLDASDLEQLRAQMHAYDELRESIIKQSRGNKDEAAKRLDQAAAAAQQILPLIEQEPTLRGGSFSSAMEEYAEAKIFSHFLQHTSLLPSTQLPMVNRDEYLGGMLDFSGELNRYAVARATQRDVQAVRVCRDLVDAMLGEMLQFDLRNGALRKKYDALKVVHTVVGARAALHTPQPQYTLRKMENVLYELSLLQGGVVRKDAGEEEEEAPQE